MLRAWVPVSLVVLSLSIGYCCIATGTSEGNTTTTPTICPSGWTYFAITGFCYMLQVNSGLITSWSTAESDCISMGGHLASIHSTTENNFILMLTQTGGVLPLQNMPWIGLMQPIQIIQNTATFAWSDGTPYDYNNFWTAIGQPPGFGGCAQFLSDTIVTLGNGSGFWYVSPCTDLLGTYVCKRLP